MKALEQYSAVKEKEKEQAAALEEARKVRGGPEGTGAVQRRQKTEKEQITASRRRARCGMTGGVERGSAGAVQCCQKKEKEQAAALEEARKVRGGPGEARGQYSVMKEKRKIRPPLLERRVHFLFLNPKP